MQFWRQPLDSDSLASTLGTVYIIVERCKGCAFCVEYCPRDVLVMSESFNRKGYHPPEVIAEGLCVNCNLCEMICPEFAIFSQEVLEPNPADPARPKGPERVQESTQ